MKQEILTQFQSPYLTVLALLLFAAVFAGILVRTFRKENGAVYERMQQLPLEEDDSHVG